MYDKNKLVELLSKKKAQKDSFIKQSIEINQQLINADNTTDIELIKENLRYVNTVVNTLSTLIKNIEDEINILESLEKNIRNLEDLHKDLFRNIYRKLNSNEI